MRRIRWTAEASDQLEAAVKHIQQDNPAAARTVAQAVIDSIEQLATFPDLGRRQARSDHRTAIRSWVLGFGHRCTLMDTDYILAAISTPFVET